MSKRIIDIDFGKKILEILKKRKNITRKMISEETGISISMLSAFFRGQKSITVERFAKICKALNIDLETFINSEGRRFFSPLKLPDRISENESPYKSSQLPLSKIPIVASVAAGEPTIIYDDILEDIDASDIIDEFFYHRLKYVMSDPVVFVRVSGTSMEPEFHDQDLLLIERNIPWDRIKKNCYGIFATEDEWTFKRFNPQKNVILLEPLNSAFNTIAVEPADLRIFGIAIGLFRPLCPSSI